MHPKLLAFLKALGFIALYFVFGIFFSYFKHLFPPQFERYAQGILGTIGVLMTVFIFLRVEKKTLKDYGLNWESTSLKKFSLGLGLGIVLALVMMLSQVFYSGLEVSLNESAQLPSFLFWVCAFIPLAYMEEVAFRSYPMIQLNRAFGLRITQVILAILFAVYHMMMGWDTQIALLGPGIWAWAYALTAISSGGIALPTGLHFGLNAVQAFLGGKKGMEPIWNLDYPADVSEAAMLANENYGIGIQIVLLIVSVAATEWYIRRKKTTEGNVYYG
ncbi:MAG: type II CAAX endopeptidase family protein [Bacteroidota bacterium]